MSRVGVGGLRRRQEVRNVMREKGAALQQDRVQHSKKMINLLRRQLESFAIKYKANIRSDPYFRSQFQIMCEKIGVDPLASSKGIWGELLGLGEFYFELGVQIIEVCILTRPHNGGIIGVLELLLRLRHHNRISRADTSVDDIKRAVEKLKHLGGGLDVMHVGLAQRRQVMVRSVPLELDREQSSVLDVACHSLSGSGVHRKDFAGCVTMGNLTATAPEGLGWGEARAKRTLSRLLYSGMVWADGEGSSASFWFLGVWSNARVEDKFQEASHQL